MNVVSHVNVISVDEWSL